MTSLFVLPMLLMLAEQQQPAQAPPAVTPAAAAIQSTAKPAPENGDELRVECSPASKVQTLADHDGCIAGMVLRVSIVKNGNVHLAFCPPHSDCHFLAVVRKSDRARIGDLSYLRGRVVALTGPVTTFRGHPRIVIRKREQIHVAATESPSQFEADRAAPAVNPEAPPRGTKHEKVF
jgi:hypothetical protein